MLTSLFLITVLSAAQEHLAVQSGMVTLVSGDSQFGVSLSFPELVLDAATVPSTPIPSTGDPGLKSGKITTCTREPIALSDGAKLEVELCLQWSENEKVLRKWARLRLMPETAAPHFLKEVIFEESGLSNHQCRTFPGEIQSYPVFLDGFFTGIEFPVAATRVDGDKLLLAHRPGIKLQPGTWYESRRAVFGLAEKGAEMRAFQRYVMGHRPPPAGIHINYNSWWTSPAPYYTEADILGLMKTFADDLYRPYNASFDTFCIDMGWSNARSLWEIDRKLFPEEFTRIQKASNDMGCNLGLWISPSSVYPPALDNAWARENGYEPNKHALCLGGKKYQEAFRDRLVDMVTRFHIRHVKLDGYVFECNETDHGHEPGPYSGEAIADGIIDVARALREVAPDIWLEPTCFGYNPSPWWLFHFNSTIGSFGDDAPYGRVPAPVYRESYTTARDFWNLQGACWNTSPDCAQEVLGVIHQTNDDFINDAVMTVMRGHMFLPIYLNPKFMNDARWKGFAGFLTWARTIAPRLQETEPLLPASWLDGKCPKFTHEAVMPREPYGYAHWQGRSGIVVLRNPWIAQQAYQLSLDPQIGVTEGISDLTAVSLYPERRVYGRSLKSGDTLDVNLAPYETLVLEIGPDVNADDIPEWSEALRNRISTSAGSGDVRRVEYTGAEGVLGPDWTSKVGAAESGIQLVMEYRVSVDAPEAELIILQEGAKQAGQSTVSVKMDKQDAALTTNGSETGWAATGQPKPENWLCHAVAIPKGGHEIELELRADSASGEEASTVSIWVWAKRPGKPAADTSDTLSPPEPETVSLGSVALLPPTRLDTIEGDVVKMERPVQRINGIYLDALDPVSVTQGYGTLQKNRSVWEKPMVIAGASYIRGLGTHAPSRIVYNLDGQYKRFQAYAGADAATGPTITFEVWVDGQKKWESGLMTRETPAKQVDVDVSGAKELALIVGDGGNGIGADHADWADAKLLR